MPVRQSGLGWSFSHTAPHPVFARVMGGRCVAFVRQGPVGGWTAGMIGVAGRFTLVPRCFCQQSRRFGVCWWLWRPSRLAVHTKVVGGVASDTQAEGEVCVLRR